MLPLKWKIFRVICFVHSAAIVFMTAMNIVFNWGRIFKDIEGSLSFLLFLFMLSILLANTFFNTWLLERCYPDRRPGRASNTWHTILFILFIIIISFFTIAFFAIFFDFLDDKNKYERDSRSSLFWVLIGIISFTGLSICYFQISLRRTIRRNYQRGFDNFLNT